MENTSQTILFKPISNNPLHTSLAGSSLFLSDQLPPPSSSSSTTFKPESLGLQRKSSLKKSLPSSSKRSVGWESPLITTRIIPSNGEETYGTVLPNNSVEDRERNARWSISTSMSKKESSLFKDVIFFELGNNPPSPSGSSGLLCFSRVKASFSSSSEDLHTRLNLKAIGPKTQTLLYNLLSRAPSGTPPRRSRSLAPPKPRSTATALLVAPAVFGSRQVNIPPIQQEVDDSGTVVKRKLTGTDENRRPSKSPRTDENTVTIVGSTDTHSNPNTDDFPNLKTVGSALNQLLSPISHSGSKSLSEDKHGPMPDDDEADIDSNDDDESLFGDHEIMEIDPISVEDDVAAAPVRQLSESVAFTSSSQLIPETEPKVVGPESAVPQTETQRRRRALNSIKVVNWVNHLKRFQYLERERKLSWQCQDELYGFLREINEERDNTYLTPKELLRTKLGKVMRDISHTKAFERRSWQLAKEIYKFWRQMCREAGMSGG